MKFLAGTFDSISLKTRLKDQKYRSPEIINELISLMAKHLLRSLLESIKSAPFYGLIADETRDISGKEQLSISLQWVEESYTIHEDVIALAQVESTDAATITSVIKDCLTRSTIAIGNCHGQSYDEVANMSGHLSGVAARIQSEEPCAHYIHCAAHSLNLCLQECGKRSKLVRDTLGFVNEICNFIKLSPKHLALFEHLQNELQPCSHSLSLKPLCVRLKM
jgi:hypothetical protein